jgi:hypothetical protein
MPNKTHKPTNKKLVVRFRTTIDETSKRYESKKRSYTDSFGDRDSSIRGLTTERSQSENYEFERYGQEIQDDFFVKNQGHGSYA